MVKVLPLPPVFVSVDPGLELGWAIWPTPEPGNLGCLFHRLAPLRTGVENGSRLPINASTNLGWANRGLRAVAGLREALRSFRVLRAAVELPSYWEDGGKECAATGALVKLAWSVGVVCDMLNQLGADVRLVPVNEWKGTMKKPLVERRIRARLAGWKGLCDVRTHAWDAVGIGLHCQGVSLCQR